jgi:hypothetical protein
VFYEDLSAYDRLNDDTFTDPESGFHGLCHRPAYTRLNVGRPEAGKPYATGPVPDGFAEKPEAVRRVQRMNVCLGVHECDLCPAGHEPPPEGNGELRIPDAPGIAYAASSLVTH